MIVYGTARLGAAPKSPRKWCSMRVPFPLRGVLARVRDRRALRAALLRDLHREAAVDAYRLAQDAQREPENNQPPQA